MPGFRQRAAREQARDRSRSPQRGIGPQWKGWVQKWAWGKASAADVAPSAHDYVEEHGQRGTDANIVRLANTCSNIQNAERVVESIVLVGDLQDPLDDDMLTLHRTLQQDKQFLCAVKMQRTMSFTDGQFFAHIFCYFEILTKIFCLIV